jgi:hypothetical protein
VIAGDAGVVIVDFAVTSAPVVELGAGNADPSHDLQLGKAGALAAPSVDEVNHLISNVMRGPAQVSYETAFLGFFFAKIRRFPFVSR